MLRVVISIMLLGCAAVIGGHMSPSAAAAAQDARSPAPLPIIRQIAVSGNQRVEADTIYTYLAVREGDPFDQRMIDQSLKALHRTGLFSDIEIQASGDVLVVRVVENPIINRVVFIGNKRIDNDDLAEEVRLRPRQVFTRSKVSADVQRMLQLYRAKGRFAAAIEPKVVQLEQNRVDILFEIQEGPKTKIRRINFAGNKKYSDGELRDVMVTKEARWWKFFTSNDTFDPDRQAYDQNILREFYLNEGYADFRTIAAVAELTPDREAFFINFTVEEGEIYEFGEITVRSEIRDVKAELLEYYLLVREGQTYSFERIQQTIESLTAASGRFGYAFVDIRPDVQRDRETRTVKIEFVVNDAPRVYVERINVKNNLRTLDKVIRREMELQEGDSFNATLLSRSEQRLNRLGYFREVEIEQKRIDIEDRIILDVKVEEQATGQLNVGAGFSSLEQFFVDFNISQDNFGGTGRTIALAARYSALSQRISASINEPYFLGRTVGAGFDVFYQRQRPNQLFANNILSPIVNSVGTSVRLGARLNYEWTLSTRYSIRQDDTSFEQDLVDRDFNLFLDNIIPPGATPEQIQTLLDRFDTNNDGVITDIDFDTNGNGTLSQAEQLIATGRGAFFAQNLGTQLQSTIGFTLQSNTLNSVLRPTRGRQITFGQDFAGVGGDVRFLRNTFLLDNYWTPFNGWTFRQRIEGGIIDGLGNDLRVIDRFFIGGPRIRGFNNAGIGPRQFNPNALFSEERLGTQQNAGSPLGGTAYYLARAELFLPLGEAALESGVQASVYVDSGSSFRPQVALPTCDFGIPEVKEFREAFRASQETGDPIPTFDFDTNCVTGASPSPRVTAGIGVSWQSPFGPFRIDFARALRSQLGDVTETLQFNVGTRF